MKSTILTKRKGMTVLVDYREIENYITESMLPGFRGIRWEVIEPAPRYDTIPNEQNEPVTLMNGAGRAATPLSGQPVAEMSLTRGANRNEGAKPRRSDGQYRWQRNDVSAISS